MTDDVIKTRNGLVVTTIILGIICGLVGIFFVGSPIKWVVGVAIGVLLCIFRAMSMTRSISKAVEMSPEDAKNYSKSQYMLRYVVTLVIAVVVCYLDYANPIGLIVGLLLLQPAVYIYNFIEKRSSKK